MAVFLFFKSALCYDKGKRSSERRMNILMKKAMLILLILCLVVVLIGTLLGNWFLGIVPIFLAMWPAAYFGTSDD